MRPAEYCALLRPSASAAPLEGQNGGPKPASDLHLYLWAYEDLNLGPLPCQGSALPLSYTPAGQPGDALPRESRSIKQPRPLTRPGQGMGSSTTTGIWRVVICS